MPYLLHLTVSPQGDKSTSKNVGKAFLESFKATHPGTEVKTKDLSGGDIPHLDGEAIFAGYMPENARSESMQKKFNYRQELISEIKGASQILVDAPMWNWSVPSVLKAYIDQIVVIGSLDHLAARGLKGKPVTIIIACGGAYGPGSWHPEWDYESGFLKMVFEQLGAEDIEVIRSEYTMAGVVPGMEELIPKKDESFASAKMAAKVRAEKI